MKISFLIDNNTKSELIPEWGLAVYIEYEGRKILLDTGASGNFIDNADVMGIDISEVEYGVLSHAHYDHADGLGAFFGRNNKSKFYLREGSQENCYGTDGKYIGIQKGFLDTYKDRLEYVCGNYELIPGASIIPHSTPDLEKIGEKADMYVYINGQMKYDDFSHEQSLVFDTDNGLVIFNSCSHGGADNIIDEISSVYPEKRIFALIGGLHLYESSDEDILALAGRIKKTGIQKIITGHCTGENAIKLLKRELGDIVEEFYTGMEIIMGNDNYRQ